MIEVEAPDGSVVEFPDNTPQKTIERVMRQQFPQAAPPIPEPIKVSSGGQAEPVAQASMASGPAAGGRSPIGSMLATTREAMFGVPSSVLDEEGSIAFPITGRFARTGAGDFVEREDGTLSTLEPGEFVAQDPRDGQFKVFMRDTSDDSALRRIGRFASGVATGLVTGPVARSVRAAKGAQRARDSLNILEAGERQGINVTLPAATESRPIQGAAAIARETPLASGIINPALNRTNQQVAARAEDIAGTFSDARTREQAGGSVREGLEAFDAPVNREIRDTIRSADDPQLSRLIRRPSRQTSFRAKAAALYERAESLTPPTATGSAGRSVETLTEILDRFDNPQLAVEFENGFLVRMREVLSGGNVTLGDLRRLRTQARQLQARDLSDGARTVSNADLQRFESALTSDMMRLTQSEGGAEAVKALRRADQFYAAGVRRVQQTRGLLRAQSDEGLYERILNFAGVGKSADLKKLAQVRKSLGPQAWDDVAAVTIRRLGEPAAGSVEEAFSIERFLTNFNKLDPAARAQLFNSSGHTELGRALGDLATVARGQKRLNVQSVPTGGGAGVGRTFGQAIFGGAIAFGQMEAALAQVVGASGLALLMTSPAVVRFITRFMREGASNVLASRATELNRLREALRGFPEGTAERLFAEFERMGQSVAGEEEQ